MRKLTFQWCLTPLIYCLNAMTNKKLIFIYNADTGLFNTVTDIAHKIFSPKSYECQLCKITHGWFSMHEEWSKGIEKLGCEIEYLHRDQLGERYSDLRSTLEFPCILLESETHQAQVLIKKQEIEQCSEINAMLEAITQKLNDGKNNAG